jgi:hypothetical protein
MPSLIGSDVAANYRQQQVPFSRFGTRKVAWYKIGHVDTNTGGTLDMTNFNKIIDAIQTQMEIVMIGAPYISNNWGKFMIAVFEDTANDGENTSAQTAAGQVGYNAHSSTLHDTLVAATGDSSIVVEKYYLFGAPETGTDDYYGFSNSDTYQEYDTKAQFVANSYTQD